jgi:FkbM family methyltransferase
VLSFFLEGRPTAAYIDFGAWIGPTALYAAHFLHHVYALEPDPMAFSALTANVQRNLHLAQHIETFFECINIEEGPLTLRGRGNSMSRPTYSADGEGVLEWTIKCRSLPQFVKEEAVLRV